MSKIYTIMFFTSIGFMLAAIISFFIFNLNFGVDFKGGSILELEFSGERPSISDLRNLFSDKFSSSEFSFNQAGDKGMVIRTGELSQETHQEIYNVLKEKYPDQKIEEKRFDSVGPVIGQELKGKSIRGIIIALIIIAVYIAYVFRKMTVVLSSWAMSIAALIALAHDIIIPIGIFSLLGHYYNIEISAIFVAGLLTILGYSVSDTVVIFDRVRENVIRNRLREDFGSIVHKSVMQTLTRSLNTTFTTLLSLIAIYFFGGESLKYFALALIIGIFLGAYSSIFVASPILVWWSDRFTKRRQ